jgi:23S rRNA pseudouridine955/2504/2580 synthase
MAQEIARHGASSTTGGYAPSREFPILFEDDFVLAIDKPAGVAVHGGSGVSFGVIEQLRMARPEADFLELVHRLDRETSGILLIAKRRMALKLLQEQFRERETDKVYLALVGGNWPANHRVIDKALHKYLLPDGERRVKVVRKRPSRRHALGDAGQGQGGDSRQPAGSRDTFHLARSDHQDRPHAPDPRTPGQ